MERTARDGMAEHGRAGRQGQSLRLLTGLPPQAALGRAVAHLMVHPAFATAPFGHIARTLTGQINRGHYAFVTDGPLTVGFLGWALAPEPLAEAWLAGSRALSDVEAQTGNCALINYFQANDPEASRFLLDHAAELLPGVTRIYARRHYPDGRLRPLRLGIGRRSTATTPELLCEGLAP